jgi:hypothetical protein
MSTEVFLRAIAGPICTDKFDDTKSAFKPVRNPRTAPFIRDPQYINPVGYYSLGSTVRWELPKIGDYIDKIDFAATFAAMTANAAVASTSVMYVDYLGISAMKEIRVSYGSQLLQRIERDQLFLHMHRMLRDEQLFHCQQMVLGGLTAAARILNATLRQYVRAELSTLWINQIESNALMVNAVSGKLAIEIDFEPSVNLIQQYAPGPVAATGIPASVGGVASPGWTDATFFDSALGHACQLRVEYVHVTSSERNAVGSLYRSGDGLRYLLTDVQSM